MDLRQNNTMRGIAAEEANASRCTLRVYVPEFECLLDGSRTRMPCLEKEWNVCYSSYTWGNFCQDLKQWIQWGSMQELVVLSKEIENTKLQQHNRDGDVFFGTITVKAIVIQKGDSVPEISSEEFEINNESGQMLEGSSIVSTDSASAMESLSKDFGNIDLTDGTDGTDDYNIPYGLQNLKNNSFINAVLQCLMNTEQLVYSCMDNCDPDCDDSCLYCILKQYINSGPERIEFYPQEVVDNLEIFGGDFVKGAGLQYDCNDFLCKAIGQLELGMSNHNCDQEFSLPPRPRFLPHLQEHVRCLGRPQGRDMASASRPYPMMRRDHNNIVLDPSKMGSKLETSGMILLLFETPSGFALFSISGIMFRDPNAMEIIWADFAEKSKAENISILRGFETFHDKSSAINPRTGVHEKLKNMIMKYRRPRQLLAVGKDKYKEIIETTLGIPCVCCKKVMEVMWGLMNHMRSLVPQEESEMTKEDRLPMSYGLRKFLECHGFDDVKPEMINEQIIITASALFDCDTKLKNNFKALLILGDLIKRVSDIDTGGWNLLKVATALKLMFCPKETDYHCMFSEDERSKLVNDADVYVQKIDGSVAWETYLELLETSEVRHQKSMLLRSLIMEAKELMKGEDNLKKAEDSLA